MADRVVADRFQNDADFPMTVICQQSNRTVSRLLVVNGNGGIICPFQRSKAVGIGAADKRNAQRRRLLRRIVKAAAQQDQSQQPFGSSQLRTGPQLILAGLNLVQNHGVSCLGNHTLHGADNAGKERVAHATNHQTNGIRRRLYQISCAVVRHIVQLLHHGQHPLPIRRADIGMVVQHAGNGTDGDAATLCYVFNRHTATSVCTSRNVTGNVSSLFALTNICLFAYPCQRILIFSATNTNFFAQIVQLAQIALHSNRLRQILIKKAPRQDCRGELHIYAESTIFAHP